jgi:hypothetical protein
VPFMNGKEFIAVLKQIPRFVNIPIISRLTRCDS